MIKYFESFLTKSETDYFISMFDENQTHFNTDNVYRFYYLDIINKDIKVDKFKNFIFKKFRIQMVNENINQVKDYHYHTNPWSFTIFLNDDFEGGELVFKNKLYKPKTGDMLYFSGGESHKVNNSIGNRYTLIGFMNNNPLNIFASNII